MESISLKAYAKVNLCLDVLGRRPNGYHDLRMVMQQIGIYDEIEFVKTGEEGFRLQCNIDTIPMDDTNIVIKACKLMFETFSLNGGMVIHLQKYIPHSAGLAGGSTDAAATLMAINELYGLRLSEEELCKLGVKLGADVPFCIVGGTCLAEGIGEVLTRLPSPEESYVLLVKPDVDVSTRHVYESLHLERHPKFDVDVDMTIKGLNEGSIIKMIQGMGNALATVTEKEHPRIEELKKIMIDNHALTAMMSGSGPSVFGIFSDVEDAMNVGDLIKKQGKETEIFVTQFI